MNKIKTLEKYPTIIKIEQSFIVYYSMMIKEIFYNNY